MDLKEKVIKDKLIYKGNFLEFRNLEVELPNGKESNRDIIRHPGACGIIAFLDDENIILVEQFRLALNKVLLEIPAGKLDKGEAIEECAKRELREETGYIAGNIEYLGSIATAPGFCDEIIYLYKATNLTLGSKDEDEDEFTNVKIMNINEVKEKIKKGEIIDVKTVSIFAYL
ncbi:NUDIX hydrolase [Clostridium isatidis]|uniref:ADP-ribose pyrophosphatase n=1 Tax=Clostridium isatidis TaxID=182773 RepID=A0A343JB86_9CLOT|nr:NUDIX hydrolase [Clostridium isatidis]ASW42794.1 ADP-ribose pyrophosphatase [Clostridium isatidis]NLZ33582.1 NUDIX hydrolase [Clostridiales bacterium]